MCYDDFLAFFQYKTYDVLSNGNYKKHLTQSKENGDSWAIDMHCRQNKVQQSIKQVHLKLNAINKSKLGIACKNVTNCAQPPIRIFLGFSQCFITGIHSDKCLDLSKNGKKSQEIHIHPKFAYFFLFLWYICKLEYVIRACAKNWMDKGKKREEGLNQQYFELYMQENEQLCKNLYEILSKALQYVQSSLDLYHEEFLVCPILQPEVYSHKRPASSLQNEDEKTKRLHA